MQYYMILNGTQTGPFRMEELIGHGLTPDTYVWHEGMTDWAKAGTLPELRGVFSGNRRETPFNNDSYRQPQNAGNFRHAQPNTRPHNEEESRNYGYSNANPYGRRPYPSPNVHTNWLPWAIVATVLNCFTNCIGLIFSIIGIVQANKANNFYAQALDIEGDAANSSAKTMTIIALVLAGVGIIGTVWVFITGLSVLSFLPYYIN